MIDKEELEQMKAYVRYDGFFVGLLMSATFVFLVTSIRMPGLQLMALAGLVLTPFYVGHKIRRYRDSIVMKKVSFRRAWAYAIQCFLYGGLVLAVVGYVYMRFVDGGAFFSSLNASISSPEMQPLLDAYGLTASELQEAFGQQRPIDVAFSLISNVIFLGFFASLAIAASLRREPSKTVR